MVGKKRLTKKSKIVKKVKKFEAIKAKKTKSLSEVLMSQVALVQPEKEAIDYLTKLSGEFKKSLSKELERAGIVADVFIGGSFAKGTLVKKGKYDVDIFVRFDWKYERISELLSGVLKKVCKKLDLNLKLVHGSRDYYHCFTKDKNYFLEIVPVTKIKKVHEERNVTDLSYFHVPYVRKKMKGLQNQIYLAKSFCYAQKVYGAETYIQGFSGYGLECMIIHFKSFKKMLQELIKVKRGDRLVIDIERAYKKKNDVFFELNESRLKSPVILIDPVYKERNAMAALSRETFEKFQDVARRFLKKPHESFFEEQEIDVLKMQAKAKKRKAEILHLHLETDRQAGDIAGTKLKKFADFIARELERYFVVLEKEFEYDDKQNANVYLSVKSRGEVIKIGPPLDQARRMKKHIKAFKKEHMNTYEKDGYLHAKLKVKFDARSYVDVWKKGNERKVDEMKITCLKVI